MKGYGAASSSPAKRRWKGLAVAVLALVFFSLLVPLAFLLGLQNRFPSGSSPPLNTSSSLNPKDLLGSRVIFNLGWIWPARSWFAPALWFGSWIPAICSGSGFRALRGLELERSVVLILSFFEI